MLTAENTLLLIVDVQGKLAHAMHAKEQLFESIVKLIKGAHVLGVPILMTEQNPKGLGPTIPELAGLLEDLRPISKFCFSCYACDDFVDALQAIRPQSILIAGIEAHICVYQTAQDLVRAQYEVQIITDAVSSRTFENKQIGIERCKQAGAASTSTETVLFELLKDAKKSEFKEILDIVK